MRYVAIVVGSALFAQPLSAEQAKPVRVPPTGPATSTPVGACATLAEDWSNAEKRLADNVVGGLGDNSAPRASLREQEDANTLAVAAMTLELMRAHQCPLPRRAPVATTYLSAALACSTARRTKGAETEECKRENWTPVR